MSRQSKLNSFKAKMSENGIDAYIIPISDPHLSEYIPDHYKLLEWLSGFSGSAGVLVITSTYAGLWTDSRYFIQGPIDLEGTDIALQKITNRSKPGYIEWCAENLNSGSKVGISGALFSERAHQHFKKVLQPKNIELKILDAFIDEVWEERPALPREQVYEHDVIFTGRSRKQKIEATRKELAKTKANYLLITNLDEIAWLFNLRGNDIDLNPLFLAFAVLSSDACHLFCDSTKFSSELLDSLNNDGITNQPYHAIDDYLGRINNTKSILIHQSSVNANLYASIKDANIIHGDLIVEHLKAIKNDIEASHFRNAMIKDGVALTHAFYWLEENIQKENITEYAFAEKLAECRSKQANYRGESFNAIVGFRDNGAIVHYRPKSESSKEIRNQGVLLVDSGGQYLDGTTDITRTIAFGDVDSEVKESYTLVLKGHIALAQAKFPRGTTGVQLDILARQPLWSNDKNYLHGTGHGVGFFLNVHEGPHGLAAGNSPRTTYPIKAGLITSNEPGYYVEGEYGIRIENLILCRESQDPTFLEFETITYFPIATNLIEKSMLLDQEVVWINEYHQMVFEKISPYLSPKHKDWLSVKCKPI